MNRLEQFYSHKESKETNIAFKTYKYIYRVYDLNQNEFKLSYILDIFKLLKPKLKDINDIITIDYPEYIPLNLKDLEMELKNKFKITIKTDYGLSELYTLNESYKLFSKKFGYTNAIRLSEMDIEEHLRKKSILVTIYNTQSREPKTHSIKIINYSLANYKDTRRI